MSPVARRWSSVAAVTVATAAAAYFPAPLPLHHDGRSSLFTIPRAACSRKAPTCHDKVVEEKATGRGRSKFRNFPLLSSHQRDVDLAARSTRTCHVGVLPVVLGCLLSSIQPVTLTHRLFCKIFHRLRCICLLTSRKLLSLGSRHSQKSVWTDLRPISTPSQRLH